MKVGNEDRKKLIVAGVLGFCALLAVFYLYETLFGGPSTPPPAKAVVVTAPTVKTIGVVSKNVSAPAGYAVGGAQKVATTSGQLDPTLHMEAMLVTESLVYTGTGRNIFAGGVVQAEVPKLAKVEAPKFPARPPQTPVPPPGPAGPPPPPPINLKFFGTATTPNGNRRAFLLNGDDVYLASVGDVVQRRYRVVSITASSILVEDMPNSTRQTLPLTGN